MRTARRRFSARDLPGVFLTGDENGIELLQRQLANRGDFSQHSPAGARAGDAAPRLGRDLGGQGEPVNVVEIQNARHIRIPRQPALHGRLQVAADDQIVVIRLHQLIEQFRRLRIGFVMADVLPHDAPDRSERAGQIPRRFLPRRLANDAADDVLLRELAIKLRRRFAQRAAPHGQDVDLAMTSQRVTQKGRTLCAAIAPQRPGENRRND